MSGAIYTLDSAPEMDGEVRARLHGEVDRSNASEILCQLLLSAGSNRMLLDLTGVRHLDSSGMAMIHELSRSTPLELVIAADSIVATAIAIAGLGELLPVHSKPAETG